jgi:hypothetical protein
MVRVMAAWIVVTMVVGSLLTGLALGAVGGWYARGGQMLDAPPTVAERASRPVMSDELMHEMVARLLDASLPQTAPVEQHDEMHGDGEYLEPDPEPFDWTDSVAELRVGRPMVAGLRPGEAIPGLPPIDDVGTPPIVDKWREMGTAAWDEWAADTPQTETHYESSYHPNAAKAWLEPIDLGNGEMVD